MARWGKCDFKQLERLNQEIEKRLDPISGVDMDAFCREAARELAARLLSKVVKRTPVGAIPELGDGPTSIKVRGENRVAQVKTKDGRTVFSRYWSGYKGGTLRGAWMIQPIEKQGDQYIVTVSNPTQYASYVEYGHRQTPGRYVPALGKSLKANWVKGRYMLTVSTQELEQQAPGLLEKKLYNFLKGCFDAG